MIICVQKKENMDLLEHYKQKEDNLVPKEIIDRK